MEMLTAKTPEMVRKELWTHLFAYTLLRALMWEATEASDHNPFQLSLKPQDSSSIDPLLLAAMAKSTRQQLYQVLLAQVTCCLFDPIALNPG